MKGGHRSSRRDGFPLAALICLAVTVTLAAIFVHVVDLKPKVGQTFFFSDNDPQVATDNAIHREFPESPEIILAARGDIRSPAYAARIAALTNELAALPNVLSVQSLSRGPHSVDDALKSPLWRPLLIAPNEKSTELFVALRTPSAAVITTRLEALQRRYDRPGFRVTISGIPYVTELIARNLSRDLRVFSIAAVAVFGLVLLVIFRSAWALLGTFIACGDSSAATLIVTQLAGIPIGPLTANLSTIVFVMTLSPIVFLTFNYKRVLRDGHGQGRDAMREAVKLTVTSSFWSSICMLLGFISLLFVPSTPMRHLGIAGAIGAVMALLFAYTVYPWLLERMTAAPSAAGALSGTADHLRGFFGRRHGGIVVVMTLFTLIGAYGLRHLNTDPDLPSYFKRGGDIRRGLDAIDANGGSSPLKLVLEDKDHAPLDKGKAYKRLRALQDSLEEDPAVGSIVSLAMVLGEAKRPFLARFLSTAHLVRILDTPKYGEVSRELISPDRSKTLFILRMKETRQPASRSAVIARLERTVARQGFRTVQVGGAYDLLNEMARLLTSSIVTGVLLLLGIFVLLGLAFSRSLQVAGAMLVSLAIIPVVVRGYIAWLGMPLDFITASASNIDLGMGVDAMIYLTLAARRAGGGTLHQATAWSTACSQLWQPIGTSLLVICFGFGIFLLSTFPPTQRFGLFVILGSATAASAALFVFPWLASAGMPQARSHPSAFNPLHPAPDTKASRRA